MRRGLKLHSALRRRRRLNFWERPGFQGLGSGRRKCFRRKVRHASAGLRSFVREKHYVLGWIPFAIQKKEKFYPEFRGDVVCPDWEYTARMCCVSGGTDSGMSVLPVDHAPVSYRACCTFYRSDCEESRVWTQIVTVFDSGATVHCVPEWRVKLVLWVGQDSHG